LIDQESNAVDLYDQVDSKGQILFISLKEGSPKDLLQMARNVLYQLPVLVKFPANSVVPCNEVWSIGDRSFVQILVQLLMLSTIQQLYLYAIVFNNVLASNQRAVVEEEHTTYSFVLRAPSAQ
jgi:hypothetical protein